MHDSYDIKNLMFSSLKFQRKVFYIPLNKGYLKSQVQMHYGLCLYVRFELEQYHTMIIRTDFDSLIVLI